MILLLGGTGDTDPIARALVFRGVEVLVSTATDYPLTLMTHPMIQRRTGVLDEEGLFRLIAARKINAVVDAAHPYAEKIGALAQKVSAICGIPYFRFLRPAASVKETDAVHASGHRAAAEVACSFGKPILLTVGSKNASVYVDAVQGTGIPLYVRVLDQKESIDACLLAGVRREAIIAARGPFSVDDNLALIRRFNIGVLVSKESGAVGGIKEKIEAARKSGAALIIVDRPATEGAFFSSVQELADEVVQVSDRVCGVS